MPHQVYVDQADAATYKEGEEVTFLRWGNFFIDKIVKDEASGKVLSMEVSVVASQWSNQPIMYIMHLKMCVTKICSQTFLQGRAHPEATNFSKTKKVTWLANTVRKSSCID